VLERVEKGQDGAPEAARLLAAGYVEALQSWVGRDPLRVRTRVRDNPMHARSNPWALGARQVVTFQPAGWLSALRLC